MNTLVLYNEKGKVSSEKHIVNALNNVKKNSVNIIFTNDLNKIDIKNYILIILGSASARKLKKVDKSAHIIVDSSSKYIKSLSYCKAKIYTCGFSDKDYITFSSKCDNTAVVSLQRDIKLVGNKLYEPFEIPCVFNGECNDYSILASVLTLILLGAVDDKIILPINL